MTGDRGEGTVVLWVGQEVGHPGGDSVLWNHRIEVAGPFAEPGEVPGARVLNHEAGRLRLLALTGTDRVLYWDDDPGQVPEELAAPDVIRDAALRLAEPAEVCDGVDEDCDGATDEGFGVGDPCDGVGVGSSSPGMSSACSRGTGSSRWGRRTT